MIRLKPLPSPGVALLLSVMLAACGSEPARESGRSHSAHHVPVSTTPSAEAAAGTGASTASSASYARTPRLKPATTWDSASLPTNWPDQDGPPQSHEIPPEIAAIPDAVPQFELRSEFGNPDSYEVYGKKYVIIDDATGFKERGRASWYGKKFHGKKTSSGEPYDMFSMTGAHKTLPIPCYARVTNLDTGHSVVIKINDRGPFHDGRVVDVSYAAAVKLDMLGHGSIPVEIEVVTPTLRPSPPMMVAGTAAPRPTAVMSALPSPNAPEVRVVPATPAPAPVTSPPVTIYSNPAPPPAPMPMPAPVAVAPVQVAVVAAPHPVAPSAPAAVAAAVPPPTPQLSTHLSAARFLQAGLFADPVNAVGLRDQLIGLGVGIDTGNVLLRSEERSGAFVYRLLIGPFADGGALEAMRTRLTAANQPSVPVLE